MQLVVEPARVAHRLPRAIPPPQSGGGRVTIGTLRPLSPLGVLKAEKAERLSTAKGEIRIGSQSRARKGELAGAVGKCCLVGGTDGQKTESLFRFLPFSP